MESLRERAATWAAAREDIVAVALVGSWARGAERPESDVDLVVLTDDPPAYVERDDWVEALAPGSEGVRTADWGALVERRIRLPSGLEVEVGIGRPSWAAASPVDPGTRRVVHDGMKALYDPRGLLAALRAAANV
ncbi:MAG TPA: nucleotidyltransferase domain-containing protein [Gaiella sp.]